MIKQIIGCWGNVSFIKTIKKLSCKSTSNEKKYTKEPTNTKMKIAAKDIFVNNRQICGSRISILDVHIYSSWRKNKDKVSSAAYTIYAKKNGTRCKKSKNSKSFLKDSDNSNFYAQGRAESRKIGLVTLRLAVFE